MVLVVLHPLNRHSEEHRIPFHLKVANLTRTATSLPRLCHKQPTLKVRLVGKTICRTFVAIKSPQSERLQCIKRLVGNLKASRAGIPNINNMDRFQDKSVQMW